VGLTFNVAVSGEIPFETIADALRVSGFGTDVLATLADFPLKGLPVREVEFCRYVLSPESVFEVHD
jgi:hypothetical protein